MTFKYNIGDIINLKKYGETEILARDPRYPITYTIKFYVKGIEKILYNVSERSLG